MPADEKLRFVPLKIALVSGGNVQIAIEDTGCLVEPPEQGAPLANQHDSVQVQFDPGAACGSDACLDRQPVGRLAAPASSGCRDVVPPEVEAGPTLPCSDACSLVALLMPFSAKAQRQQYCERTNYSAQEITNAVNASPLRDELKATSCSSAVSVVLNPAGTRRLQRKLLHRHFPAQQSECPRLCRC